MSNTPNLKLPYIDANQNQKSVTHNAALTILDALVNLQVQSNALAAPPGSPADGQCWIVAAGGSGAWAGKDLNIAAWQDGAWNFYAPNRGFVAYVDSIGSALVWNGTAWVTLSSGGGGGGGVTSVAGRTGAVTLAVADVSGAAPLASPALSGSPTAPTQTAGDNSTKLATTAFVQGQGFVTAAGAAAAAPVQSVAGRGGAVTLAVADVSGAAPLASPALTGNPTAPTQTAGDSSTKLATTGFVAASFLVASNAPALGIGTAADSGNPLSTKLNSALFTALPTASAGTGDVRVKLSKQAAANTASFLFQDNFSGRAEIGLTGDDNFHFKVSSDGTTFYDAIVVTGAGGAVAFLVTPTFPTAAAGDSTTKGATTAFVGAAVAAVTPRRQISDAAATIAAADRTVAVTALTAARTLTLPAASAYPGGATLTVVDESGACSATNTLTIAAAGTDTINGAASAVLSTPYSYLALASNTSNKWTVIDQAIVSPLPWANGGTGDTGTAWTAYTPTVSPSAGTLTAYTATGRYKKIGRTVFVQMTVLITTNGTGATGLSIALPFQAAASAFTLAGRESGVTGKSLVSAITANATSCFCANYDATYPGANGASITLSGLYESAS